MNSEEYETLLKVGLEIHFQLSTEKKLFCDCEPELVQDAAETMLRCLRPTQSELGQVDPAALFEFQKGMAIKYLIPPTSCCLVEMDEEPPHPLNRDALKVVLKVVRALNSTVVEEIHVMRKIVIDGSNTTGFQRTAVVALGGIIVLDHKTIPIQSICIEEDAARLIKKTEQMVVYSLDRLAIPLIEVTTAPVINTSEEAVEAALEIGRLVKASGCVKNELGVIRQDVNISYAGGRTVEVKGVQRLSQLRRVVEFEKARQQALTKIAEELGQRRILKEMLVFKPVKVTDIFSETGSALIRRLLEQKREVYALKLPGFKDLLGKETAPGYRIGTEMAERVRFWTLAKGLFHTDEMPSYGITEKELVELKEVLDMDEIDAAAFIVEAKDEAIQALKRVWDRALEALNGVPYETRGSREDGTTYYMRPRPGMARMYPETDIPPMVVNEELLEEVDSEPIQSPRIKVEELVGMGLSNQLAWKLYDSRFYNLFLKLAPRLDSIKPSFLASVFTETIRGLRRKGIDISVLSEEEVVRVIEAVERGLTAKESVPKLLEYLTKNREIDVEEALEKLDLSMFGIVEVESIVGEVISANSELAGMGSKGANKLIGLVMARVRGRADPRLVLRLVKERLGG